MNPKAFSVPRMHGSDYFQNNSPEDYSVEKFIIHCGKCSLTGPRIVAKRWNEMRTALLNCTSAAHVEWAKSAEILSKHQVNRFVDGMRLASANAASSAVARASLPPGSDASSTVAPATLRPGSDSSSIVAPASLPLGSDASSESAVSSVSAPSVINASSTSTSRSREPSKSSKEVMEAEYVSGFNSFQGDSWILPSGIRFDDTLLLHVLKMKKESSLHSFVLDSRDLREILKLFTAPCDVEAVKKRLEELNHVDTYEIPDWQLDIFDYYDSVSAIKMASRKGWGNMILFKGEGDAPDDFLNFSELIFDFMHGILKFFKDHGTLTEHGNYKCSDSLSEWKYVSLWGNFFRLLYKNDDKLTYDEGEVVSNASSARKNFLQSLEDRQADGLKVDGILYLSGAKIEIGAMEAGKEDEGQYGTKFLVDSVKLAKLLKDMFDFACTQAGGNGSDVIVMMNKFEVYGFLISGLRVEFVSLKYLGGRHFYFNREGGHSLPDLLNDDAVAKISRLGKQFLIWRSRIEANAVETARCINGKGSLRRQKYEIVPTLPTPPPSPRLKKLKI